MKTKQKPIAHFFAYGFYFKTPKSWQILLFFILLTFEIIANYYRINQKKVISIETLIFLILWWLPLTSGLANLFRNIYISIIWLSLCIFWFFITSDFITSILPLIIFMFMHVARLIHKFLFKKEPIFLMIGKSAFHYWDKIENRESNNKDFIFSMITMFIGGILSITIGNI